MGKSVGFGPELVFAWLAAVPHGCWGGSRDALRGHRGDFAAASPSELVAPGCFGSWWVLIGDFEAEL